MVGAVEFGAFQRLMGERAAKRMTMCVDAFEVELVGGETVEVEELPAVYIYCEEQCGPDCSGRHKDAEVEALAAFPGILAAFERACEVASQVARDDHATRRAESGYAQ